jgi:uncharacterized protein (TIGR00299 family) protein
VRVLYLDCFSGASGDMILGALVDAGVPFEEVRHALGSLAVTPDLVRVDRVVRAGVQAAKFQVRGEAAVEAGRAHDHHDHHSHEPHHHDHHHAHDTHAHGDAEVATAVEPHVHAHRTLDEIFRLIDGSALSGAGKDRARALFHTLGEAEAAIHGTPIERVHLHEVGALDSIVDIVGTVFAMERIGAGRVVSSPLNVGSGSVEAAHGRYPVPAPATLRLLRGAPIYAGPERAELVTPTGALLVTAYASAFGTVPPMRVQAIGYGAGSRDFADSPNVLRVLVGESDETASPHAVAVIEAEIDDMSPQIFGVVMDRLLGEGALDVFYTPIHMKKNRPGVLLSVIAPPALRDRLVATIFRQTTTIGVRHREMARECLDREVVVVETPLGPVRFKVARLGGATVNAAPEFDDCVRLAGEHGLPAKEVLAIATKAYLDRTPTTWPHRS